jgi:MFS family permease
MTYSTLYSKAMGISNISLAYTIYGVGLVCTRLLAAKLIDKHGAAKVGTISITILMIGFTIIGIYPTRYGLFIGSLILSVGCGMITPTLLTMAVNVVGSNRRGSAIALIFTGFDIGMGVGSWFFGWVADIFGNFNIAYLICAVVEIAAFGIFWHLAIPNYKLNKVPENT